MSRVTGVVLGINCSYGEDQDRMYLFADYI